MGGKGDRVERESFCVAKNSDLSRVSESKRKHVVVSTLASTQTLFKGKKNILALISEKLGDMVSGMAGSRGYKNIIRILSLTISCLCFPLKIFCSLAEFYQKIHYKKEKQLLESPDIYITI